MEFTISDKLRIVAGDKYNRYIVQEKQTSGIWVAQTFHNSLKLAAHSLVNRGVTLTEDISALLLWMDEVELRIEELEKNGEVRPD